MQASHDSILGSVLNTLRRKAGVSVPTVLSDLDCSESQYVRYELGRIATPYDVLRSVLERIHSSDDATYVKDFFTEVAEFEEQLKRIGVPVVAGGVGEKTTYSGEIRKAYADFCAARDYARDLNARHLSKETFS